MNASRSTLLAAIALLCTHAHAAPLTSPDRHISVDLSVSKNGMLTYAVSRDGKPVILPSALGLQLKGIDLSSKLTLSASSPVKPVRDSYELATAKKRHITYSANEQTHTVRNAAGQAMDVSFRASNDGVAFRYVVRAPKLQFVSESTSFAFDPSSRAWLQPMSVAKTG